MVLWKKYRSIQQILERVPMIPNSNMSEPFLVMWRFKGGFYRKEAFECRQAHILKHNHGDEPYVILISGISGKVDISHWTEITKPKSK